MRWRAQQGFFAWKYNGSISGGIDGKTLKATLDGVKVEPDIVTENIRVILNE